MPRPTKNQPARVADLRTDAMRGGGVVVGESETVLAPAAQQPGAPANLQLTPGLSLVAAVSRAHIAAQWDAAEGGNPASYVVEWWPTAGLVDKTQPGNTSRRRPAGHDAAKAQRGEAQGSTIPELNTATEYAVRVAAVMGGGAVSPWSAIAYVVTPVDLVPPGPISDLVLDWSTGDLTGRWTPPSDPDFAVALVRLYDSAAKTQQYGPTIESRDNRFTWTAAANKALFGATTPKRSVYVEVATRDYTGNTNDLDAVGQSITNAPPPPPANVQNNWDAAPALADGTFVLTWDTPAGMLDYAGARVTIGSRVFDPIDGTRFELPPALNRTIHGGTANATLAWSVVIVDALAQASSAVSGTSTNLPPGAPTSLSQSWADDDGSASSELVISWTIPAGILDLDYVRLHIDGTEKRPTASPYRYSLTENQNDHGGVAEPALTIEVRLVDALGQPGPALGDVAVNAPPPAPTSLVSNWLGDPGTADESLAARWSHVLPSDHQHYTVSFAGVSFPPVVERRWNLDFDTNRLLAGGPKTSGTLTITAMDDFGQASPPATLVLANTAPPAPTITAVPFVGGIFATLGLEADTVLDSDGYIFTLYRAASAGGTRAPIDTVTTRTPGAVLKAPAGAAYYTVGVTHHDLFAQARPEVLSTEFFMDPLTLDFLRALVTFTDHLGTANLAGLKDDNRTAAATPAYASGSAWTAWVEARRERAERIRKITIVAPLAGGSSPTGYIAVRTAADAAWTYYAGPIAADGTMTLVANESAAQAAAAALPVNGTWTLPGFVEARYVRLTCRHTTSAFWLAEFFPRSYLQIDDLDAEIIRGMRVSGQQFITDQLSALSATLGQVDILTSGWLRSGQTAYNNGIGFYLGNDSGTPRLSLGNSAGNRITWNGTTLNVVGTITVTGGNALTTATNYAGSSSPGGAANDTAAVNGVAAATVRGGAERANSGLTGSGFVALPVRGANLSGVPVAGLNLTATGMGYYDGSAWKTYILNDGQFFFDGPSAYLHWTGSVLAGVRKSDGVVQWQTDATNGSLIAAAGNLSLGSDGVLVRNMMSPDGSAILLTPPTTTYIANRAYRLVASDWAGVQHEMGGMFAHFRAEQWSNLAVSDIVIRALRPTTTVTKQNMVNSSVTSFLSRVRLIADRVSVEGMLEARSDIYTYQGRFFVNNANGTGVLGYRIRTDDQGGWRWQFIDGANNEYFGVEFPTGHTSIAGLVGVNGAGINAGIGLQTRCVNALVGLRVLNNDFNKALVDVWDDDAANGGFGIVYLRDRVSIGADAGGPVVPLEVWHPGNASWGLVARLRTRGDQGGLDGPRLGFFHGTNNKAWAIGMPNNGQAFAIYEDSGEGSVGTSRFAVAPGGRFAFNAGTVGSFTAYIVALGTTSATHSLVIRSAGAANDNFWIRDDGAGWLRAASWSFGSDIRLKDNIRPLGRGLDELLQLEPVLFDYINGRPDQMGFVAQQVKPIMPELIDVGIDGMLGLQTGNLIPVLVRGVQQLAAEVAELKARAYSPVWKRLCVMMRIRRP